MLELYLLGSIGSLMVRDVWDGLIWISWNLKGFWKLEYLIANYLMVLPILRGKETLPMSEERVQKRQILSDTGLTAFRTLINPRGFWSTQKKQLSQSKSIYDLSAML